MADKIYTIRGRSLSHEELEIIRLFLAGNWQEGRSAISKLLCRHWDRRQSNALLETFVERQRFAGTCYKAANWHCSGETKGRGNMTDAIDTQRRFCEFT